MAEPILKVDSLWKRFSKNLKMSMIHGTADTLRTLTGWQEKEPRLRKAEFWALKDISLELRQGECLGLIGTNGSGKSTLMRIIAGIFPPDKGRVEYKGRLGALISLGAGFHPHMTGRENIFLNGSILGLSKQEIKAKFDEIVNFSEIEEFIDAPVSTYSSGMRVKLGFSIAIQSRPDILLIDEVLSVGDYGFRIKCFNAISETLSERGAVFVSHSMQHVSRICNKLMLLEKGAVLYYDTNVEEGIEQYHKQFEAKEVSFVSECIKTLTLRVNGAQVNIGEQLTLIHNEEMKIGIRFLMDKPVGNIICSLVFQDSSFNPIALCRSNMLSVREGQTEYVVECTIPRLQFLARVIGVTLDIRTVEAGTERILLGGRNILSLVIKGTFSHRTYMLIDSQWTSK